MASIIASGTTAADSDEFTLADGVTSNVFISGSPGVDASAAVYIKTAGATFTYLGQITHGEREVKVYGPGTFKVSRAATATAFGVDRE